MWPSDSQHAVTGAANDHRFVFAKRRSQPRLQRCSQVVPGRIGHDRRLELRGGLFQKAACLLVPAQQGVDTLSQWRVVAAHLIEPRCPRLAGRLCPGPGEKCFVRPLCRHSHVVTTDSGPHPKVRDPSSDSRHGISDFSEKIDVSSAVRTPPPAATLWRKSNSAQQFGAKSASALAVCSMVSPAKYLRETSRANSGRSMASCVNASSRASRSGRLAESESGQRSSGRRVSISATFQRLFAASALHQNPPHRLGCGGVEVPPMIPFRLGLLVHQAHVGFMHQGGRLQRVSRRFTAQLAGCQPAQLVVHQRQQLRRGGGIALLDGR